MIAINKTRIREGLPHPRGATWQGKGVNFALFSAHGVRVELCLFDETAERETARIDLPEYTDEIWHGYVPEVHPGTTMVIAFTAHMSPAVDTASIRISWCSILMPTGISAI